MYLAVHFPIVGLLKSDTLCTMDPCRLQNNYENPLLVKSNMAYSAKNLT